MDRQNALLKNWQYIVIAILLILSIWLGKDRLSPGVARDPATRPADALACSGDAGTFSCKSSGGQDVGKFTGLPGGVTPYLLAVGDDAALRALPKDGFQCLASIITRITFYNSDGQRVAQFAEPVTFQYILTAEDIAALTKCNPAVNADNLTAVVPVYLYLPSADSHVNIWKPFQNYDINSDGTITIVFKFWGDPQFGAGTQ